MQASERLGLDNNECNLWSLTGLDGGKCDFQFLAFWQILLYLYYAGSFQIIIVLLLGYRNTDHLMNSLLGKIYSMYAELVEKGVGLQEWFCRESIFIRIHCQLLVTYLGYLYLSRQLHLFNFSCIIITLVIKYVKNLLNTSKSKVK